MSDNLQKEKDALAMLLCTLFEQHEAIQRVDELHKPVLHESHYECEDFEAEQPAFKCTQDETCIGYEATKWCEHCGDEWPCDTKQALDGEQE